MQFAVVDVECSETIVKLQARDKRIGELNLQVLRLKDQLHEQVLFECCSAPCSTATVNPCN